MTPPSPHSTEVPMPTYAPARPAGCPVRDGLERILDVLPTVPCPWRARRTEVPGADLRFPVPHDPRELGALRRRVRRALDRSAVPADAADEAVLVVSELVTNAVTHGTSPAELRLVLGRGHHALRVEVTDAGPAPSGDREGVPPDEHGRGLPIVAALASDHGVSVRPGRTTCWADLPLDRPLDRPRRHVAGRGPIVPVVPATALAVLLLVAVFAAGCLLRLV
ncbi:ATP-binding protein [Actinacidiphila glaucinigra]|uniref:ATP-binding protein n=1 Tax=Actinacidiphila glaucinigra TaxID=235986 RepID=UPI002DD81F29|nr:ATP-binding protein [Actinacidiphila glaucinigra]WSD64255.1 ATP-binding protein [Actinacidiphila glaucinigra]